MFRFYGPGQITVSSSGFFRSITGPDSRRTGLSRSISRSQSGICRRSLIFVMVVDRSIIRSEILGVSRLFMTLDGYEGGFLSLQFDSRAAETQEGSTVGTDCDWRNGGSEVRCFAGIGNKYRRPRYSTYTCAVSVSRETGTGFIGDRETCPSAVYHLNAKQV